MKVSLKARRVLPLCLLALSLLAFGPGLSFVQAKPSQRKGAATACASNLKNMATAMEMYSTDWSGKYPPRVTLLAPNYLRTIPKCPASGKSYLVKLGPRAPKNIQKYQDYYFLQCTGHAHKSEGLPASYPQYTSIEGLLGSEYLPQRRSRRRTLSRDANGCISNLKNLATAMEMYSTDWAGKYPPSKRHLVPNYLRTLPACPVAKKDTYRVQLGPKAPGNSKGFRDYYLLSCQGRHHSSEGYPQNFPKYTSIQGVRKKTL